MLNGRRNRMATLVGLADGTHSGKTAQEKVGLSRCVDQEAKTLKSVEATANVVTPILWLTPLP